MEQQRNREPRYDEDKVDEMALALLWLTAHRQHAHELYRAWKGMDWDVIDRLEAKGLILNSRAAKSVVLTQRGEALSSELFHKHFGTPKAATLPARAPDDEMDDDSDET